MKDSNSSINLNLSDAILIIIITFLSMCVRIRSIHFPTTCVFDEVYFGNFTNFYLQHTFYQDIHPPFAKLLMYKIAETGEYNGDLIFNGKVPYKGPEYTMLRLTPAVISSFVAPLVYLSVRFIGFSISSAFTSGMLAAFDTSLICEGRYILTDGILHFFSILHVAVLFYTATIRKRSIKFHIFHVLTGITLGLASSIKNTAWGLMVLDAVVYLQYLWPEMLKSFENYATVVIIYGVSLFLINFLVFWGSYVIHFLELPYIGNENQYLLPSLQHHFVPKSNSSILRPRLDPPNLLVRSMLYIYYTHKNNMLQDRFHISQSHPYNWPFLTGIAVYFYGNDGREIRCMGNVFSYYFGAFGIIMCCFAYKRPQKWQALTIIIGYSACFFPFFLVPRVMYLYHYCIPLMLAIIAYGAFLDIFIPPRQKGIIVVLSVALCMFGYWLWSPYIYALPMRNTKKTIWNKAWVVGDITHIVEKSKQNK